MSGTTGAQSGANSVNFYGTQQNSLVITVSSVGKAGSSNQVDTVNMGYADVTLNGASGLAPSTTFNLGVGTTFRLASATAASGASVNFNAPDSHFVVQAGVNIGVLRGIFGFQPGNTIDVSASAAKVSYADNAGAGTGGTLTLFDGNNTPISTVAFGAGDYVTGNFQFSPDGSGGTIVNYATAVTGVTASPQNADVGIDAVVVLNVGVTDPLTISNGTPTLALNDGGTAIYSAKLSTSTNLVFVHTVAAGQNTADLAITGINLNGATLSNTGNSPIDLSGIVVNPAGILQVDTTAPILSNLMVNPGTADLGIGQTVQFTLDANEAVTVTGSSVPTLTLNDGGVAIYSATLSTPTRLVFLHTVQAGQNAADLAVVATNLNGSIIADGAGNAATLLNAIGNPAGTLQIDTTAPILSNLVTNPGTADLGVGQTIQFTLDASEAITVTGSGTPTLALNDGGVATYSATLSTPTRLVFVHTVQAGQNAADLAVVAANLNGSTITDGAGNAASLLGAVGNPAGILQVDTTAPILSNLMANPGTADLGIGQTVQFTLDASEAITVTGSSAPTLALNDGGVAIYSGTLSTPTRLVFLHTVQAGQNAADLAVLAANLNGSTIADGAGNAATLLNAIGNPAGTLQIDTTAPLVTGANMTPSDGTLRPGQTATISVGVNEPVTVKGGVPTLALNDGGTATYDPVNSTPTKLVFTHTLQPGQNASDLAVTGVGTNGATIADLAGNGIDLSGVIGNPSGTLRADGSTPTITTGGTSTGSQAGTATNAATATLGVYRFFDSTTGTHFFTSDTNEKDGLKNPASRGYRQDMVQETNNFGAIDPNSSDASKVQVYRFFDTAHGTHFFTASQGEADTLRNSNSIGYRPDLVFEASSSFYEHATQQSGDTAVYRFFDKQYGTHFYTGDQKEYTDITTAGASTFRPDLVSEGIGFYAPTGTFT